MRLVGFILFLCAICASPSFAADAATQPSPGITYRHIIREKPPLHLHLVTVDLTNTNIHIKVAPGSNDLAITAPWETSLLPVSKIAQREGMIVAVNGNYFIPKDSAMIMGKKVGYFPGNWARTCGFAMADGKLFSENPPSPSYPCFIVNADSSISISRIEHAPPEAKQIVAGQSELVTNGQNATKPKEANSPPDLPAPRTAIGFDRDHKKLVFLVVDGRRLEYSAGLTKSQLAQEMIDQGCWKAIDLDGGGSSTLVIKDPTGEARVINRPSDGWNLPVDMSVERSVANAVGIVIDNPNPTTKESAPK